MEYRKLPQVIARQVGARSLLCGAPSESLVLAGTSGIRKGTADPQRGHLLV